MLRTRLSDIEPTETSHKKAKTGENKKHLHKLGIKFCVFDIGIWRKWSMSESVRMF